MAKNTLSEFQRGGVVSSPTGGQKQLKALMRTE